MNSEINLPNLSLLLIKTIIKIQFMYSLTLNADLYRYPRPNYCVPAALCSMKSHCIKIPIKKETQIFRSCQSCVAVKPNKHQKYVYLESHYSAVSTCRMLMLIQMGAHKCVTVTSQPQIVICNTHT